MGSSISLENPAVQSYAVCASVLIVKMLLMAPLTTRQRLRKRVFASHEDEKLFGEKETKNLIVNDPDVERVRRAHLNDLENIPAFLFIGGLYLLTDPSPSTAVTLMRTYTGCRILHTLVYAVWRVPQPARGLAWIIGYGITLYMAAEVATYFM